MANFGGVQFQQACKSRKKNRNSRKSRENSRNLLKAFLRSRKEENLYGHCDMNNVRRILSKGFTLLRGCWNWSKKLHFRKNFDANFIAVERITKSLFAIWSLSPQRFHYYFYLSILLAVSEIFNHSDTCAVPSGCNAVGLLILLKLCNVFTFLQQLMTKRF